MTTSKALTKLLLAVLLFSTLPFARVTARVPARTIASTPAPTVTQVTVTTQDVGNWRYGGTTAALRVYASTTFFQTGAVITGGRKGSGQWYQSISCTVAGTVVTIPWFNLYVTTNSPDHPEATYTFVWVDSKGTERDVFLGEIAVPESFGAVVSFQQLEQYHLVRVPAHRDTYPTTDQVNALIAMHIYSPATTTLLGVTKMSAAPADSVNPIAVGKNDYASASNKGVTSLSAVPADSASPIAVGKNDYARITNKGITSLSATPDVVTEPIALGVNDYRVYGNYVEPAQVGGHLDLNADLYSVFKVFPTAPITSSTITYTGAVGKLITIIFAQAGGAPGPTVTWPSNVPLHPTVDTAPSAVTTFTAVYDGSGQWQPAVSSTASSTSSVIDVTAGPYNADKTGATDASAAINTAITAAVAAGTKRVYLPTGTYLISGAYFTAHPTVFGSSSANLELFGDGEGKTIVTLPASVTLGGNSAIFAFTGVNQSIHDLTILGAATVTGAQTLAAISLNTGAYYPHVYNVEISGLNNNTTAGAIGIDMAQAYNNAEVSTTLGTTIVAGSRTVTPASMTGIYRYRLVSISGTTENVLVTSVTASTFTGVFAIAHASTDTVTSIGDSHQYALIENNHIHDSMLATGMAVNSSANIIRGNRIVRVGSTQNQHGIYVQAGANVFEKNWIEGAGGYSFHQHLASNHNVDASANRYIGNTSLNPLNHMIADDDTSNGTNVLVPNGISLDRSIVLQGNFWKSTHADTGVHIGVYLFVPSASVTGDIFEDTENGTGYYWLSVGPNSTVQGCIFRSIVSTTSKGAIEAGAYSTVTGNSLNFSGVTGISAGSNSLISDNILAGDFTTRVFQIGSNGTIANNRVNQTHLGANGSVFSLSSLTGIDIYGNRLVSTSDYIDQWSTPPTGSIHDNTISGAIRYDAAAGSTGLFLYDNDLLVLSRGGYAGLALKRSVGRLTFFPNRNMSAEVNEGTLVKLNASGELADVGTGDTAFVGMLTSQQAIGVSANGAWVIAGPAEVTGLPTDGAWTAGHVGIVSVTTAGKIHDNGTQTPPAYPASYVIFLDSGGGAGSARVQIVKTF
jgi:hypothetical protein